MTVQGIEAIFLLLIFLVISHSSLDLMIEINLNIAYFGHWILFIYKFQYEPILSEHLRQTIKLIRIASILKLHE